MLLSLPSFLRRQAIRYAVWSTLVLNATCWVLHFRFHTPFQYTSTILLCGPGENHNSLKCSLHFLVGEGDRIKQTLYRHHDKKWRFHSHTFKKSFTSFWLLAPWSKNDRFYTQSRCQTGELLPSIRESKKTQGRDVLIDYCGS